MEEKSTNTEIITESGKEKRKKNLKPAWKEGEPSPNPDGRPLGQKNYSTLYKEALIKLGQLNNKTPDELELELVSSGFTNARKGDYRFYKDVLDRLHGQATSKSETNMNLNVTSIDASNPKVLELIDELRKANESQ